MIGTLCNSYTSKIKQFHWEKWETNKKKEWQSTQQNYENGSSMTQKGNNKKSVQLETTEKLYRGLVWQPHKAGWKICYWGFTHRQWRYLSMKIVWHSHKEKSGKITFRKWVKNVSQSKEHNCDNGSSMIQKEKAKRSVYLEAIRKCSCVTVTQKEWNSRTEKMSERYTKKMCGNPINIIVRMGQQWL